MLVNLDPWLQLEKWVIKPEKGVEVIDKCLSREIKMPTPKKNITPRKKSVLPAKYREFIVDKPIAYCPKCLLYVRDVDKSVVCKPCQAYWHHACAEATLQDLEEEWDGISFVCQKHREEQNQMVLIPVSKMSS